MKYFLFFFILFSFANICYSREEIRNMDQMLDSIQLEKKEVESMIDKLVESGRISLDDGKRVKREVASMKDEDLDTLKDLAVREIKNKKLLEK